MALNAFYSGKNTAQCLQWALEEFSPSSEEEYKDFERLTTILKFYWENVAVRDRWKVLEVERKLTWERSTHITEVLYQRDSFRFVKEEVRGGLQGILDLIVQDNTGRTFIVDHKFQRSKQVSHLETDSQVSFYLLLAHLHDIKVDGMLYNIIPMSYKESPEYPVRRFVTRSKTFLQNFRWELERQIELIEEFSKRPRPTRSFTRDCVWDCALYRKCLKSMEDNGS